MTLLLHLEAVGPACALQLRTVSRATWCAAKPYAAVITFALTRPHLSGPDLPLSTWQDILAQCCEIVRKDGLDVGAWVQSIGWYWPDSAWQRLFWRKASDAFDLLYGGWFLNNVFEDGHGRFDQVRIAHVLALRGWHQGRKKEEDVCRCEALVYLSDGQFGLITASTSGCCFDISAWLAKDIKTALGPNRNFHIDMEGYLAIKVKPVVDYHNEEAHSRKPMYSLSSGCAEMYPSWGFHDRGATKLLLAGERRTAEDGFSYTRHEFRQWYGAYWFDFAWAWAGQCGRTRRFSQLLRTCRA